MGTMVQRHRLEESDFRGSRFAASPLPLKGCNDILSVTRPDIIREIHRAYIDAGADIIETNSFNANAISLAEYGLSGDVREINLAAARVAVSAANEEREKSGRTVYVAGSIGPGNVSLSMPSDAVTGKDITFDTMRDAYAEQACALIEGGVDVILLETIFDTLNAKAAVAGIKRAFRETGKELPLMLSMTLTRTGRTLSGQTPDAFVASMLHANACSVGLNCGFGAAEMKPYLEQLQKYGIPISLHPNAGLPDEMGQYTETPAKMGAVMKEYMDAGLVNIAGGCCGTTPEHIRVIAEAAGDTAPRILPAVSPDKDENTLLLSGLHQMRVSPATGFVKVGERCNVAGSRKFLRLINEQNQNEALSIAAGQIKKGAAILDINMDDGMLDTRREMDSFVSMLTLDPSTADIPLMIDSSRIDVILSALKRIQGRPVVNSISLKEGEEKFLEHAREIRDLGGTPIVMAFDEKGQATTFERRVEICRRAYTLLTEKAGFRGTDIIFDPNILTIATGMPEHDRYALDFLDAIVWIKENLPGAKVSGGVSNLSFAFRGNNPLREAMHTVFLHHAGERGMDMAIVNPSTSLDITTVDTPLREAIEDVIFCRREDASARLLDLASAMKESAEKAKAQAVGRDINAKPVEKKGDKASELSLREMVVTGITNRLEERLAAALAETGSAMDIIKGELMEGMNSVGEAFGEGRMFLPQVVRSAGVMKQAINWLTPYIEAEQQVTDDTADNGHRRQRVILATVKGDVHDIGKNIVAVVLRCSGFDVTDLGVMVDSETILSKAKEMNADFIGLSGLITPSLSEMVNVATRMEEAGMQDVTLLVGGATTSALHTAVKIAPAFSGLTVHTGDAAALPEVISAMSDPERREEMTVSIRQTQEALVKEYRDKKISTKEDNPSETAAVVEKVAPQSAANEYGVFDFSFTPEEVEKEINWKAFRHLWRLPKDETDEFEQLKKQAQDMIRTLTEEGVRISARAVVTHARRQGDDIILSLNGNNCVISTLRREETPKLSMADFVAESDDTLTLFAVTIGRKVAKMIEDASLTDDYKALLLQSLADRLVEAATEHLHSIVYTELLGKSLPRHSIRPAFGYPSLPDQSLVLEADKLLHYGELGIDVTENGALYPNATTTGLIFGNPDARYFEIGKISREALTDYARRRNLPIERIHSLLPTILR